MKKFHILLVFIFGIWGCLVDAKKIKINYDSSTANSYEFGVGIYDITGPAGHVGMMGYAMMDQITEGIHFRLRARAFIIGDGQKRIVFVSTDSCMIFTSVKNTVVQRLSQLYGDLYTADNVMLSGTHTHAGPAGYAYYLLYDIMSFGFMEDNFEVIVNGIVQAISMAHNNMQTNGNIYINSGELLNSNINRSPSAYLNNPASERAKYSYDVDKTMTLLKFVNSSDDSIGLLNWFSVHGTSMSNTNRFISGDNKGYASYLMEKHMNGALPPGIGPFVAAFAQTNEGDVSPNTKGAFCPDGTPCSSADSVCNGRSQGCQGYGPGVDDFDSTRIIGLNQFNKALDLFNSAVETLSGPVDFIHTYLEMDNITVDAQWTSTGQTGHTCLAALGDSFAAGTTDGCGDFDFTQGTNSSSTNPYWNFIGNLIAEPTEEQIKCQSPKPILINVGGCTFPTLWVPEILPIQIFRIGQLFILGVPGEFTTMSGRRLRDTVQQTLQKYGAGDDTVVVIAGLTNAYSHYITTYEEFQYQRYEGASTIYGPHTLAAYQQEFSKIATALIQGQSYPPGPNPPDLSGHTYSFFPELPADFVPPFHSFGDVFTDANNTYAHGDTVYVSFYGGNPNHDLRTGSSYLTVEQYVNNNWQVIRTDGDWDTKYHWTRRDLDLVTIVEIYWTIGTDVAPGSYRIQVFGSSKDLLGKLYPYTGTSGTFQLTSTN